jgi:hypothetical protein
MGSIPRTRAPFWVTETPQTLLHPALFRGAYLRLETVRLQDLGIPAILTLIMLKQARRHKGHQRGILGQKPVPAGPNSWNHQGATYLAHYEVGSRELQRPPVDFDDKEERPRKPSRRPGVPG